MAKIYKENQRIKRPEIYLVLGIFSLLLAKEWFFFLKGDADPGLAVMASLTVIFGLLWWVVLNLRLRIRIGKHLITVKYEPIIGKKHIINLDRVKSFEFYKITESALLSGWGIRFFSDRIHFTLGDNAGLYIKMKDGTDYVISSSRILCDRDAIEQKLIEKSDLSRSRIKSGKLPMVKKNLETVES